jgi:hypothetical protein
MKQLPLGITDFAAIREQNYYYADKTKQLYELARGQWLCFLYLPQGSGKTILISALDYILQGRRDLFRGLWIDQSDYDWKPYPVLRLDMSQVVADERDQMEFLLTEKLASLAGKENLSLEKKTPFLMLKNLISLLYNKYNNEIAVLVDDYDAPTNHHIDDPVETKQIRNCLIDFYRLLKSYGHQISHIFMTGLKRFNLTTEYSGLNNIIRINLIDRFYGVHGLTEAEINDLLVDYPGQTIKTLEANGVLHAGSDEDDFGMSFEARSASRKIKNLFYSPLDVFNYLKNL